LSFCGIIGFDPLSLLLPMTASLPSPASSSWLDVRAALHAEPLATVQVRLAAAEKRRPPLPDEAAALVLSLLQVHRHMHNAEEVRPLLELFAPVFVRTEGGQAAVLPSHRHTWDGFSAWISAAGTPSTNEEPSSEWHRRLEAVFAFAEAVMGPKRADREALLGRLLRHDPVSPAEAAARLDAWLANPARVHRWSALGPLLSPGQLVAPFLLRLGDSIASETAADRQAVTARRWATVLALSEGRPHALVRLDLTPVGLLKQAEAQAVHETAPFWLLQQIQPFARGSAATAIAAFVHVQALTQAREAFDVERLLACMADPEQVKRLTVDEPLLLARALQQVQDPTALRAVAPAVQVLQAYFQAAQPFTTGENGALRLLDFQQRYRARVLDRPEFRDAFAGAPTPEAAGALASRVRWAIDNPVLQLIETERGRRHAAYAHCPLSPEALAERLERQAQTPAPQPSRRAPSPRG
jgi:hypothetical protein